MIPLTIRPYGFIRLLLATLVLSILVWDRGTSQPVLAQETAITLQDAVAQGQVEVSSIVGNRTQDERSFYAQPMLLATLQNLTSDRLAVELPAGTRMRSTGNGSDLLALRFTMPQLVLEPNEARENVGIEALLLGVEAFPANDQIFELGDITTNAKELAVVTAITEQGGYGTTDIILADVLPRQGTWTVADYYWLTDRTNRLIELTDGTLEVLPILTERMNGGERSCVMRMARWRCSQYSPNSTSKSCLRSTACSTPSSLQRHRAACCWWHHCGCGSGGGGLVK